MNNSNIIMYTTEDGLTKIETTFEDDTVWLSLDQMAELFQRDKSTISRHIKKIFEEGELQRNSVVANFATTECSLLLIFLFYIVFLIRVYFRLTVISRHRHINRIIISIDILQLLLLLFQPFDMTGSSGRSEIA